MEKLNPKYIIVHHTATSRDKTTFDAVKRYHTQKLGWSDIGYHFFIDANQMLVGRLRSAVGAHCRADRMNYRSLGVAVTGNFKKEYPTKRQLDMLKETLDNLGKEFNIPKENVLGHKEVKGAKTVCPGKNLMAWLVLYRKDKLTNEKVFEELIEKTKEEVKEKIINYIKGL